MKKKILMLLALLCLALTGAWAKVVEIGTGTTGTTGWFPTNEFVKYSLTQQIYKAKEIGTAGTINSIAFYSLGSATRKLDVYLAHTTKSGFSSGTDWVTPMSTDLVYSGSVTYIANDWTTITLSTPFEYNGTENLCLIVDDNTGSGVSSCAKRCDANYTSNMQSITISGDYTNYNALTPTSYSGNPKREKNQIKFDIDPLVFNLIKGETKHGVIAFTDAAGNTISEAQEGQKVTVTITPDEGWMVNKPVGQWYAAVAASRGIDLLNGFELTALQGQSNQWTFTMTRANAKISATYKKLLTNPDITIGDIASMTYTGQALTPSVTVQDGSVVLTEGTDYTLSYKNNVNAALSTATNAPTVIITAVSTSEKYAGKVSKTFTIDKADAQVTKAPTPKELTYDGTNQTLINAGSAMGGKLLYSITGRTYATYLPAGTNAGEYTVYYKIEADANHNDVEPQSLQATIAKAALTSVQLSEPNLTFNQQEQLPAVSGVKAGDLDVAASDYTVSGKATDVGNYTVTVTANADAKNFTGSATAQYSIVAADANLFDITLDPETFVYDGKEQTPTVTVKDGGTVLSEGTDYTLAYTNNVNVGTATVTATGKGNYSGTKTAQFTIQKADVTLTAPTAVKGLVYTGEAQTLIAAGEAGSGELQYSTDGETYSTALPTGTDAGTYTVYYKVVGDQNHNAAEAQSLTAGIAPAKLTAATLVETNLTYNQQEQTAEVASVTAGTLVVPEDSYEVSGNKATNVDTYTVTVTGKGNYQGSVTAQFSIVATDANLFVLTLDPETFVYDGTEQKPAVTVKDGGTVLSEGTDYTLVFTNNVNAGTATVTATGKGNYSSTATAQFTIQKANVTLTAPTAVTGLAYTGEAQTLIAAGEADGGELQYSLDGVTYSTALPTGTDAGTYTVYYKVVGDQNHNDAEAKSLTAGIAPARLTVLTLAQTQLTYNQQEQSVGVSSVKAGELAVTANSYDISGNKATEVGTYTVTVTGKGNFAGTATAQFSIVPAGVEANFDLTLDASTLVYDGKEKKPAVTVQDGSAVLSEGTDYTLSYTNNVDAGTATVIATGMGNYSGTKTAEFTISPATLTSLTLTEMLLTYNREEQTVGISTVKAGKLTVPADGYDVTGNSATDAGIYTVTVTGKGNYTGTAIMPFMIVAADADTRFTLTLNPETFVYDGTEKKPAVTVQDGGTVLSAGTDYMLSYENNVNVGTATVTATGKGNYNGTKTAEFTIQKAEIALTAPTAVANLVYNGEAQTLIAAGQAQGGEMQYSLDGENFSTTLPTGTDAGEYTVYYKITADANHDGAEAGSLRTSIAPAALTSVLLEATNLTYNRQEQSPEISGVKAGDLDVDAADYTVSGKATEVGTYTLTVTGKGNFTGEVTAQYSIVAADANLFDLTLDPETFVYDGTEKRPAVTVQDGGTVLSEGTDYTLSFKNNVNAGTATVTATGKGNYSGTRTARFTIQKADVTLTAPMAVKGLVYTAQSQALVNAGEADGGELLYSTDNKDYSTTLPTGTDAGEYSVYYKVVGDRNHRSMTAHRIRVTIAPAALTEVLLKETNLAYNQQEQTAEVATVHAGDLEVPADSYDVEGNVQTEPGEYTVTVTGKGNFTGKVTATFVIEETPYYPEIAALLEQLREENGKTADRASEKGLTDAALASLQEDKEAIDRMIDALEQQMEQDRIDGTGAEHESDYQQQLEQIAGAIGAFSLRVDDFPIAGDTNGDDMVDIDDHVTMGQMILGKLPMPTGDLLLALDLNGDGSIGVGDLTGEVNLWMGRAWNDSGTEARTMENANEWLSMGTEGLNADGTCRIDIALGNEREYAAFVMDIVLPEGMELKGASLSERGSRSHELLTATREDGSIRLLASSMQNDVFGGTDGVLVSLDVTTTAAYKGGSAEVRNAIFATPETTEHAIGMTGSATGVKAIDHGQWTIDHEFYGLDGRRQEVMKAGVNIVRRADGTTVKIIRK